MYTVSKEVSDIKGEFEGGVSFKLNWYTILRQAKDAMLGVINPETLKRRVPVYGGFARGLFLYYCPDDVHKPSALYPNDQAVGIATRLKLDYVPPNVFFEQPRTDTFTIETVNGKRFVAVRHRYSPGQFIVDEMEEVGSKVSDVALEVDQFDFLYGTGAIKRRFYDGESHAFTADASSDTLTSAAHGLEDDEIVYLASTGALPTGLSLNTKYYVVNKATNTFQVSLTKGGSAVDFSTAGTGTLTWFYSDNTITDEFASVRDISAYTQGIALVPFTCEAARDIASVEFYLYTDASNYYKLTSSVDSIGDTFIDGINMARFAFPSAEQIGTPNPTSIASWMMKIVTDEGTSQEITIDKITLQKAAHHYFEYYSSRPFIDATTGAYKDEPTSDSDLINLGRDAKRVLHFEACRITFRAQKLGKSGKGQDFDAELKREYDQYNASNPSTEKPLSYSILPDIAAEPDFLGDGSPVQDVLVTDAENELDGIAFADNDAVQGTIDGVNATFTLSHAPSPSSSLQLYLNGILQRQGTDYELSGATITYVTPPNIAFASAPHTAFYRYLA
jgi:hypothetical protein